MKLMVIDGNSIINRAYYGIRPLTTREGLYTHAIYGFLSTMSRLKDEEKPDALCVTFDRKEPTFRHLKYDGYKAQRKAMPEELSAQMPVLKEVLDAMNVPRYELAGWEADDLIGTIAAACEAGGWECVAVTGDKDSFQLIGPGTSVRHVKTRMGQTETVLYDTERFEQEYDGLFLVIAVYIVAAAHSDKIAVATLLYCCHRLPPKIYDIPLYIYNLSAIFR